MVTEIIKSKDGYVSVHGNGLRAIHSEYYCLSTDPKPYDGVENADVLYEMDTKKAYLYDADNGIWIEQ
jgi:hypothetical protein